MSALQAVFERFLSLSRLLALIPVVFLLLDAAASFIYGTDIMVRSLTGLIGEPAQIGGRLGVFLIVMDTFLVGATLMVAAFGFYELFITRIPGRWYRLPRWLRMHDLEDLKARVTSMLILVVAITFVDRTVESHDEQEVLFLGLGISIIIVALTLFLWFGKRSAPAAPGSGAVVAAGAGGNGGPGDGGGPAGAGTAGGGTAGAGTAGGGTAGAGTAGGGPAGGGTAGAGTAGGGSTAAGSTAAGRAAEGRAAEGRAAEGMAAGSTAAGRAAEGGTPRGGTAGRGTAGGSGPTGSCSPGGQERGAAEGDGAALRVTGLLRVTGRRLDRRRGRRCGWRRRRMRRLLAVRWDGRAGGARRAGRRGRFWRRRQFLRKGRAGQGGSVGAVLAGGCHPRGCAAGRRVDFRDRDRAGGGRVCPSRSGRG